MKSAILKAVGFVHLHVHSAFSLREGALTIETLAKLAAADAMPALAITDTNNLFGALEFSEKLAKGGVQPIVGAQVTVDFGDAPPASSRLAEHRVARAPIVLLAQSEAGYRTLMRLVSALWLAPKEGDEAHVPVRRARRLRRPYRTDRRTGRADRQGARPEHGGARQGRLRRLAQASDKKLYVELQRHGLEFETLIEPAQFALPTKSACRWSRPTRPISPPPPTTRRMTRFCASPGALLSTEERRRLSPTPLQDPRRNDRPVRRPAGRRRKPASRSPCAAPIGR